MRIFGALLLVVLLAVAAVLFLQSHQAKKSFDAVSSMADQLREPNVDAISFDRDTAVRLLDTLADLVETPDAIDDHVDDLRLFARTAAGWAEAARTPSDELRVAVSIRGAADELRSYALRPSQATLARARRLIAEGRRALSGEAPARAPTDALRDRLRNVERAREEEQRRLDEALGQ